ncbi:MAG TPA: sigma-70 family RNA polymerase sigma factor [Gaiellaceae bacterium]
MIAAECGDSDACRKLVEAFLPAIAGLALGFQSEAVERRELLQEGVAGLLFAARRYDPDLNTRFWAYASFWVRKAMQEFVAELARPVALSDRAVRDLARIRSARREHQQTHRAEPTTEDLSRATGLTRAQIESLQMSERTPRAIDEPFAGGDGTTVTIGDTLADPAADQAYQQVLDELEIGYLRDLTAELDDRERAVVRAHYGLGERARTLSEIGSGLGLTAERARQIEVAALGKLRARLAQPKLPPRGPRRRRSPASYVSTSSSAAYDRPAWPPTGTAARPARLSPTDALRAT